MSMERMYDLNILCWVSLLSARPCVQPALRNRFLVLSEKDDSFSKRLPPGATLFLSALELFYMSLALCYTIRLPPWSRHPGALEVQSASEAGGCVV